MVFGDRQTDFCPFPLKKQKQKLPKIFFLEFGILMHILIIKFEKIVKNVSYMPSLKAVIIF